MSNLYCRGCNSSANQCSCDDFSDGSSWTEVTIPNSPARRSTRGCPDIIPTLTFRVMVSPVTNLVSSSPGQVQFSMRRKAGVVFLSWEPFSGVISANGVDRISVAQSIPQLPQYPQDWSHRGALRGTYQPMFVRVDPNPSDGINISFYLSTPGTPVANAGDAFAIPGGSMHWIWR